MIQVFIEAEAGSRERHRYNEKTLEYKGTYQGTQPYPYPYGFILRTTTDDGDNVDCYVITKKGLKPGTIVECEPIGLLEQNEAEEIDHKVLVALPGQHVEVNQDLQKELSDFIYAVFAEIPGAHVRVGQILPREAAISHIQKYRDTET